MQESNIAWTDSTWNPTHGCSKVSSGCGLGEDGDDVGAGCYAERISRQYEHTEEEWTTEHAAANVSMHPEKLEEPYNLSEPSRIFVNSMSDLFHSQITDEFIRDVFAVMRNCPHHVFQILTKRPGRAAHMTLEWPENVWMGTSVEDNRVTERIDLLRDCDAQTLFLSFEPLVGPVGEIDLTGYEWAIVGGESGPGYRDMEHEWAREIYHQCLEQEVDFFFKQSSGPRPEMGTRLSVENEETGLYEQRRIREIPDLPAVTKRARDALERDRDQDQDREVSA